MLYVVGTPIGNLEDVTLRSLEVLRNVPLIAAEDTRRTKVLLQKHGIKARLTSFHEHNSSTKLPVLLEHLKDKDLALVSEAGMPGLSDPGYDLISAAIERGILVTPIPGPSAVVAALVVSGLPTDRFTFAGFLPRKAAERRRFLASLAGEPGTIVAFEAPHRLLTTLQDIVHLFGQRRLAVCRELTKVYEEVFRGTAQEALGHFQEPRGEFTLVIEGNRLPSEGIADDELREELRRLRRKGMSAKEAVRQVSQAHSMPRNRAYRAWLALQRE